MLWLGIDTETTGLTPGEDRVIEVGAVLYDMERHMPVRIYSDLVCDSVTPEISQEAAALHGITHDDLERFGVLPSWMLEQLSFLSERATHFIAHNAEFDRAMLEGEAARLGVELAEKPWICSQRDVPYPERYSRKLEYLAAHHGFVNPFAHRALFDVLTMFKVLERYDTDEILKWSAAPNVKVRALVTYDERSKAKERAYRWDAERKWWVKDVKDFLLEEETKSAAKAGFEIRKVDIQ